MGYRFRQLEAESKFCQALSLDAIGRAVPWSDIQAVLVAEKAQEQRERKLNQAVVVLMLIAMNLYPWLALSGVMRQVARGLRLVWADPEYPVPQASALSYRRYQLGARPLVALCHRVCHPLATPATPGAFRFGLRLMAIDGTVEDVPDSPENAAACGRHTSDRGASAFPQVLGVYLVECGTHAIVDAGFWPCHTSEHVGARRLLRSVGPGMLVMWDRGLHGYDQVAGVRQQEGHVLSRLAANVKPEVVRRLSDGTYLAYIYPSDYQRRKHGERLLVRIIEYTITDPALPGHGEIHRLLTTLLDPDAYPALDLACAYHERWEIEIVIDEVDTHQRLAARTLRSLKPVGVIQELYALLLAHYAVRFLMHEAALLAQVDPDRLSFVHALEIVREAIPEFQMVAPEQLDQLYTRMLRDIASVRWPERRLRSNPRVVRRKMSKFHLKRPAHYHQPQPTLPLRRAVALI